MNGNTTCMKKNVYVLIFLIYKSRKGTYTAYHKKYGILVLLTWKKFSLSYFA